MLTVNGSAYVLNDLLVMGTLTADAGFDTNGVIWADTIKGNTVEIADTISATNGISTDGDNTASGKISCSSGDSDSINTRGGVKVSGNIACININTQGTIVAGSGCITLGGVNRTTWQSTTITHLTNIIDYDDSKIGCFCETCGELADVYDKDGITFVPTLSRPCDAIVKVRHTNTLSTKLLGIIANSNTIITHGDCLAVVKLGPKYEIGQLLVPDIKGVCRIATEEDKRTIMFEGLPRVRITGIPTNDEPFVLAFMS
jgi:hypothetical protein